MQSAYFAITAWEKVEIPNKYTQPYNVKGEVNKYAGMATITVWRWLIIGKQETSFQVALQQAHNYLLRKANKGRPSTEQRIVNPNQLTGVYATMYNNLKIVRGSELSKYRITLSP